jgi:serine/threonine-protein kinase RsbW
MIRSGLSVFSRSLKPSGARRSLRFSSDIRNIRRASLGIVRAIEPYNVAEDKIFDIRLCVEEAVRNAMVHGNGSRRRLKVEVRWRVEDGCLLIEVEDEGNGFDHLRLADPTSGENVERNCGRGVYLIKKLMDKVEFNAKGNVIRMTKRIL